jgi:glycosyltransferase involved in cell wall biosynthesis
MSVANNLRKDSDLPVVAVLLATHNPTETVEEQINSIYAQNSVKVKIYWGDDRSTEEKKDYVRKLLAGKNYVEIIDTGIGATKNFLHLLRFPTEEYIAFSDQDDIWLPDKLIQHISLIKDSGDLPALSHSNSLVLENGKTRKKKSVCQDHTFYQLSWQNCVQGCTILLNSKAQQLLNSMPQNFVLAHDWWAAQVISLYGKIFFNKNVDLLYRIHSENEVGLPGTVARVKRSVSRTPHVQSRQALEILRHESTLPVLNQFEVEAMRTYWEQVSSTHTLTRFKIALTSKKGRKSQLEDFWRKATLLFRAP